MVLLNESILRSDFKGKNLLYHSTTIGRGIDILNDNKIYGASKQKILTKLNPNNSNYNNNSNDLLL